MEQGICCKYCEFCEIDTCGTRCCTNLWYMYDHISWFVKPGDSCKLFQRRKSFEERVKESITKQKLIREKLQ